MYAIFEERHPDEEHWASREELLNAHGYKLRPRLRKDWIPSWRTSGENPLRCEDGEISSVLRLLIFWFSSLTALQTPLTDGYTDEGKFVCIKSIPKNSDESRIAQMLSTKELREDPRNHCVPIIEVFDDPDDDSLSYLVMPLLRNADSPPFQYIKEIIDFVDQILEVGPLSLRSTGFSPKLVGTSVHAREWGRTPVVYSSAPSSTRLTPR